MAAAAVAPTYLSFKYRLLPSRRQHEALGQILESQRELYNAALEERIGAYKRTGRVRSYAEQCRALTEWRQGDADAATVPANLQRWTLRRLDHAYGAFYRRLKRGGKAGLPRFRGAGRWRSFGFNEFSGIQFDGARLRFRSMPGGLRVHLHRPLPAGRIFGCSFMRDAKGWTVHLLVGVDCEAPRAGERAVGLDLGLINLVALSDGSTVPNPRHARRVDREIRRRKRALSRCKRGSRGRVKAVVRAERASRRATNARTTHLHQVSADLVRRFDLIAVENLNVKGLAASSLAKSVHDASWGRFQRLLKYKAERAGARVVEVSPIRTSQTCSGCGNVAAKTLKERTHSCSLCGLVLDRDHNAALNILRLGVVAQGVPNVAGYGERAPGNLMGEHLP